MGTQEPQQITEEETRAVKPAGVSNNVGVNSYENCSQINATNENNYNSVSIQNNQNNNKNVNLATTGKKIRRAFSMPRNPFRWSRKFKTINTDSISNKNTGEISINNDEQITDGRVKIIGQDNQTPSNNLNQNSNDQQQIYENKKNDGNNFATTANRVFRRSSFRKFLTRIAQHVSLTHKHSTTSSIASDRVPPIGGYQWPADQTPGVTGLKNHGNTCFMNAVLQCLSHTDILAEYFVLDQYKADLKRRNKINSRKFGTKGELTEELANVLKALWTCRNESDHSTSFKAVVDRYGVQFRSSTQHDAQEFLFWLLDKVHEDLNTATKRRYKNVKNNYGRPDEIIAAETLANHIRCNNSFVQAVFQAQFRSSLTCPRCKKQSNTFDPFHCISVQLPQLTTQTIFVTVLYLKQHPQQVKLGLTVQAGSAIIALRKQLHTDTGIEASRIVLTDINETGFSRVFYDSQPTSTLEGVGSIYCIEIPEIKVTSSSDLMLLVANVHKLKDGTVKRFGAPFCLQATRDCSYSELQKKLLKQMSLILKPEVFGYTTPLNDMFQIRLQDPSADPDTYLEQVEHPLFTEIIDMALSVLSTDAGPAHIKLLLEWSSPEDFFVDLNDAIVEHESVSRLKDVKTNEIALTLEQCLEHYTKAETLSAEDAWRCPHCQQYLPVVKTLGLWSLPDILVIHFKRFRQHHDKGGDAAKLTTMVKFPLNAFDMSPHLAKESTISNDSLNVDGHFNSLYNRGPWNKFKDNLLKNKEVRDNRYDLYAVCYHQGDTLETGHYTAACKNPYDHQWYKFDDQRVSRVLPDDVQEQIINNEAYILFYQRRNIENNECSGSSSISGDHWISKIAAPVTSSATASVAASNCTMAVPVLENNDKMPLENEKITPELEIITPIQLEEPLIEIADKKDEVLTIANVEDIKFADEDDKKGDTYKINIEHIEPVKKLIVESLIPVELKDENSATTLNTANSKIIEIPDKDINNHKIDSNDEQQDNISTKIMVESPLQNLRPNKSITSSIESISQSQSHKDIIQVVAIATTPIQSHKFMNGYNSNDQFKEAISSSLKSNNSLMMNAIGNDLSCALRGSTSSNSSHCVSLRHSISNSSNYKFKECSDTLSSMLRNSTSTCSKDTLIFIDQQGQSIIEDDDTYLGSRSLWISPVTPHKLITVSPKN